MNPKSLIAFLLIVLVALLVCVYDNYRLRNKVDELTEKIQLYNAIADEIMD